MKKALGILSLILGLISMIRIQAEVGTNTSFITLLFSFCFLLLYILIIVRIKNSGVALDTELFDTIQNLKSSPEISQSEVENYFNQEFGIDKEDIRDMYNGKNPDDTSTYFFKFIEFLIFFICIIFLLTIIGVFFVDNISGKDEPDILLFITTSISTLIFMFYSKRFETIFKTIFFGFLDLKWKRLTRVISIIISLYCVINFFETGEPLIISFVTLLVIFLVSWICKPFFEESDSTKMAKLEKNLSLDAQRDIKKLKDLEGDFEN